MTAHTEVFLRKCPESSLEALLRSVTSINSSGCFVQEKYLFKELCTSEAGAD